MGGGRSNGFMTGTDLARARSIDWMRGSNIFLRKHPQHPVSSHQSVAVTNPLFLDVAAGLDPQKADIQLCGREIGEDR